MDPVLLENTGTNKRLDYLPWSDYFMGVALLAAQRSKDPTTQVGSCIVNDCNVIIGVGYNGFPRGVSDDEFTWDKCNELDNKYLYVCHAEMNAILNLNCSNAKNCVMYTTLFPCNECTKLIIQAGISQIFYLSDKHADKIGTIASKKMLNAAKIAYKKFIPKKTHVILDFSGEEHIPRTPNERSQSNNVAADSSTDSQISLENLHL